MITERDESAIARRRLILRDSLAFLTLVFVTLVLFGVTLALFRSFSAHREDLAKRWSGRGMAALKAGHPEEAVVALRTALSYAPETRDYELLLAQALGEAGRTDSRRTDESYNYFMALWEKQPGDGLINLQLARLAARRGDRSAAVEFYRASIYGTWQGDGVIRRAEVRLELARYLLASGDYPAARMELLIAEGNVPESPELDQTLAGLLTAAKDPGDAWNLYQKALAAKPRDPGLLQDAGRLAYEAGDYAAAGRLLSKAQALRAEQHVPAQPGEVEMATDAIRIAEMAPLPHQPSRVRGERVLLDLRIAKHRLDTCLAAAGTTNTAPGPALEPLVAQWPGSHGGLNPAALRSDADAQDTAMQLVYQAEVAAQKVCAPAAGDDALLLMLANRALANAPAITAPSSAEVAKTSSNPHTNTTAASGEASATQPTVRRKE